jgi:hypothetical protein
VTIDPNVKPQQEPADPPRPGRKWTAGLAALIVVFVALAGYDLLSGGVDAASPSTASRTAAEAAPRTAAKATPDSATPAASSTPSSSTSRVPAGPAVSLLTVAAATAYGPDGPSDGDHPDLASGVINGGDGEPWHSSWYDSPDFGNLQSGTGLLLEMGQTVTVSSVRLQLGPSVGASLQVWVEGMPVLTQRVSASAVGVGGSVRLQLATPAAGRFVLIWFTQLPPNGQGKFQATVYSAAVYGTKGTLFAGGG